MCWFECFLLRLVVGLFAVGTRCLSGFHNKTSSAHSTESQGFALQQVSHLQRPQNPQSPQWWWDASADLCPKFSGGQSESGDKKLFGLFSRKSLITIPQKSNQVRVSFVGHESEVTRTTQKLVETDAGLKEDLCWLWCPSSFQCFNAFPSLLYIFKRGWHWD